MQDAGSIGHLAFTSTRKQTKKIPMSTDNYMKLHWLTVILLIFSALLSKQTDMAGLPLNLHMIIGFPLVIVMIVRVAVRVTRPSKTPEHLLLRFVYTGLYISVFCIIGMGGWIAYQRNLMGYLLNPNSAVGRGSFKLLADVHKLSWQILCGWVSLHVGVLIRRFFFRKEAIDGHI